MTGSVITDAIAFTFLFWLGVVLAAVVISLAVTATRKVYRQWKGRKMNVDQRAVGYDRGLS